MREGAPGFGRTRDFRSANAVLRVDRPDFAVRDVRPPLRNVGARVRGATPVPHGYGLSVGGRDPRPAETAGRRYGGPIDAVPWTASFGGELGYA